MKINYRKHIITGLLVLAAATLFPQNFTWLKGSTQTVQQGTYGILGSPGSANTPGARSGAASWRDANGNFWLFGGDGRDYLSNSGFLNDLWKYSTSSNQWTWVKGDNLIAQQGVYGTMGVAAAGNKPGGRHGAVTWLDISGRLWLYGGYGYDAASSLGYLNDLWKYNIGSNEWTWVGGSNLINATGNYGSIGVPAASNSPSSRTKPTGWVDGNGNLWMFGGYGSAATPTTYGSLCDLWRYQIATNTWTWMKGSSLIDQFGVYGAIGVSNAANNPGGRTLSQGWTDANGNFWLFGGEGFDQQIPIATYIGDLWKYNLATNEWTWMNGSNNSYQTGVYGTLGVPAPSNRPGSRRGAFSWTDAVDNLWLFGGQGLPGSGTVNGELNDLWKYDIASNQWAWIKGSATIDQTGTYGTLGAPAAGNRPGGRNSGVSWIDFNSNLWLFGGSGFPAAGSSGKLNDVWKYTNCFVDPITMTIVAQDSVICAGESTSLTVSGSTNYFWPHNSSTQDNAVISPVTTTTYYVNTGDSNGCTYTAEFVETVSPCTQLNAINNSELLFRLYPNPSAGNFYVEAQTTVMNAELVIYDPLGQIVFRQVLGESKTQVHPDLSKGIYLYEIRSGAKKTNGKLLVE